jgi:hypothetical protein
LSTLAILLNMEENQKKAFDFAADTTKQLITIATAIITLTITFSKDIIGGADNGPKAWLIGAWAVFILSIIFGVGTLMTLTGTLQPLNKWKAYKASRQNQQSAIQQGQNPQGASQPSNPNPDVDCTEININNGNIRLLSMLQAISFIAAIIMTGWFGYTSLSTETKDNKSYTIIRKSLLNNDTSNTYIDTLYLKR